MEKGLSLRVVALVLALVVGALAVSYGPVSALALDPAGDNNDVAPGATLTITSAGVTDLAASDWTTWAITTTGAAKATFESGGGTTLVCQDATSASTVGCDTDATGASVKVKVKIADDSGAGAVVVRAARLQTPDATSPIVLTVKPGLVPTSLTITPKVKTYSATAEAGAAPELQVKVTNSAGKGVAVTVQLTTNLGQMYGSGCASGSGSTTCTTAATRVTPGTAATDGTLETNPRVAPVASRTGMATVTASVVGYPAVKATATVTFYGTAKNIAVASEQGSVEIGGKTFVVVTVTDDAGAAVSGVQFGGDTGGAVTVTGPKVPSTALVAATNVPREGATPDGDTEDKGELPHCDSTTPETPTAVTDPANYPAGGTNDEGKCLIEVSSKAISPATTRGPHTVKVALPAPNATTSATATITVGGPPTTISSDAPASMNPSDEITVNLTVKDDEGELVGAVTIEVLNLGGIGLITANAPAKTTDGVAKFSYLATSQAGTAEFLARTKNADGAVTAKLPILITVGDPEPEDTGPTVIELTAGPVATYVAWNDDWGTVSSSTFENVPGLVIVWKWTGTTWFGYTSSPTAPVATKTNYTVAPGDVLYVVSNGAVTITLD